MKKLVIGIAIVALFFGFSTSDHAYANVKKYKNCTELNKDYKGGVAKAASVQNKGGKTKYKPHVSKELYEANKNKDRDKDGIACER